MNYIIVDKIVAYIGTITPDLSLYIKYCVHLLVIVSLLNEFTGRSKIHSIYLFYGDDGA